MMYMHNSQGTVSGSVFLSVCNRTIYRDPVSWQMSHHYRSPEPSNVSMSLGSVMSDHNWESMLKHFVSTCDFDFIFVSTKSLKLLKLEVNHNNWFNCANIVFLVFIHHHVFSWNTIFLILDCVSILKWNLLSWAKSIELVPISRHLQVKVKVILWPTVSWPSVLVSGTHLGPATNFSHSLFDYFCLQFRVCWCGSPLWWEVGSVLFSFCRVSPAQPFSDLSLTGLMSIVYCLYFWGSPNQEGQDFPT
jgi:hypothetical protein